jgi:hypothetical protein
MQRATPAWRRRRWRAGQATVVRSPPGRIPCATSVTEGTDATTESPANLAPRRLSISAFARASVGKDTNKAVAARRLCLSSFRENLDPTDVYASTFGL